jgi:hypothetical protein
MPHVELNFKVNLVQKTFKVLLGQVNLISRLSSRPKNMGRVGGFYFIIFISPKKNYWWQFCFHEQKGMLLTCVLTGNKVWNTNTGVGHQNFLENIIFTK